MSHKHKHHSHEPVATASQARESCQHLCGGRVQLEFLDGFDEAILGIAEHPGGSPLVVYDAGKILASYRKSSGLSAEAAERFFEQSILPNSSLARGPLFLRRVRH